VVKETLLGALATTLMQAGDEVVSIYHRRIEHGYPTPSLGRDEVLAKALPWLQQYNIWSRGRFGSYKVGAKLYCMDMNCFYWYDGSVELYSTPRFCCT
jgi:hypothetical protein